METKAAFSEEASINTARTEPRSESPSKSAAEVVAEPVAAKVEKTEPVEAKPAAPAPQAPEADEDATEEVPMPKDLEGFEKALKAARGDARKNRKQWRAIETEKQAIERKLATLEGELRGMRTHPQSQIQAPVQQRAAETDPDSEFYTDGPGKFFATREQAIMARINERMIDADRRAMRRAAPDYEQAEAAFVAAAQTNPSLAMAMRSSDDPVGFAYANGKELLKLQELGATSVEELEAKVRAKVVAELAAAQAKPIVPAPVASVKPPIPPKSNAQARGSGAGVSRPWAGPRSTEEVWREGPSR